jgi:SAM-dependent methyltransferase
MAEPGWFQDTLGEDCSAPGFFEVPGRIGATAYVLYRGITIAAWSELGRPAALGALRAKVEARLPLLRDATEIAAAQEVNFVQEPGPGGMPQRRFVRPMSRERAAIELELGVDGALIFLDEATGNFVVASRGAGGDLQFLRLGEPVHGDDAVARPLPIPGVTPTSDEEERRYREKARRIRPLLRCPACRGALADAADGLRCERCVRAFPSFAGRPVLALEPGYDASPVGRAESSNTYGQQVLSLIEKFRDGWVLDCGSGRPSRGFYNVVHLELFAYPEVDVVTDGQALPFAGDTFDAVLSEAVLEHVRDPDGYVREVARVVKPGGFVRLDVGFMVPYHGYPDHYFNMTRSGLELVVERAGMEVVSLTVDEHQHPFVALSLMMNGYAQGTADPDRRKRLLALPIGQAIDKLRHGKCDPFDGLTREAIDKLAAGFACVARKRGS